MGCSRLVLRDIESLRTELSIRTAGGGLQRIVGDAAEPYLGAAAGRHRPARPHARACCRPYRGRAGNNSESQRPYLKAAEFAEPLLVCHRALVETGNALIAEGRLTDILRRVAAFGLTLAPLDLRQEAARHTETVEWIARAWQLGPFESADEEQRVAMLLRDLESGTRTFADLPQDAASIPAPVRDVIATFQTAAALPADSLGAYVITMASRASDVLAVEWLQKLAGTAHPQRVVPLFERVADLERSGEVLDSLFTLPWYAPESGATRR